MTLIEHRVGFLIFRLCAIEIPEERREGKGDEKKASTPFRVVGE
jgi:hypothetical protein